MYFLAKIFIVSFSFFDGAEYVGAPQNYKNNSIRIYSGYFSRPFINILFLGDISAEYHNTIIRGIDYSKVLKEKSPNSPISTSARISIIRHLERGFQNNHNQYNLSFTWHYHSKMNSTPIR